MFHLAWNLYKFCKAKQHRAANIVILGLNNAGKSTVASCLKNGAADASTTPTVGFAKSTLARTGGTEVSVYDLGGGANFRGVWKHYFAECYGAVFVFDATDTVRFDEAANALRAVLASPVFEGKPVLLLANKQDVAGAMTADEIAARLDAAQLFASTSFRIEPCVALQTEATDRRIVDGYQWLVGRIATEFKSLRARVARQVAEQREREAEEKEAKRKRIEKMREEREQARLADQARADAGAEGAVASAAGVGLGGVASAAASPAATAEFAAKPAGAIARGTATRGAAHQPELAAPAQGAEPERWAHPVGVASAASGAAVAGPITVALTSAARGASPPASESGAGDDEFVGPTASRSSEHEPSARRPAI